MSFDEQPDGDPHGECAAEIGRLQALAREAYEAWDKDRDSRVGKLLLAMLDAKFCATYRPDLAPPLAAPLNKGMNDDDAQIYHDPKAAPWELRAVIDSIQGKTT